MTSPLSGSLAKTIGSAFKGLFLDAVLTRETPGTGGDPFDPPPPVVTTYSCKAVVEAYSDYFRKSGLVNAADRKVLILAASLAVKPQAGDRVTIQHITFTLSEVSTDPATAVWECRGAM
jgi:hypothetical protein